MKKGTDILAGFNVKSATLIDSRECKNTIADRDAIETVTDGLKCFVLEDETLYIYYNEQ